MAGHITYHVSPVRSSSIRILCHGVVELSPATLVEAELF